MSFEILCQDSVKWLEDQPNNSVRNFITGIPDLNELGDTFDQKKYIEFFNRVSLLIFKKIKRNGYAIFLQTDRKINGQLIDKSYLLTHMAYSCGFKLVWHKIVCQRDVGKKDLFRPTYSHFLCYTITGSPGAVFEDILPVGGKLYENATPYNAALSATEFLAKQIVKQKLEQHDLGFDVVDPFVGQGTIGVAAIQKGLSFLGIDIEQDQCHLSKGLLEKLFSRVK